MPRLSAPRKHLVDTLMREAIYEAAISVLTENGVERTTMDRVAAAADVGKGSLYKYFQSKEELLQFVYEKTVLPILESLEEIVATDLPAPRKLEMYLRALLEHSSNHVRVFNLLLRNDALRILIQSSARSARATAVAQLATVFRQGAEEGLFRPLDSNKLADLFLGSGVTLLNDYLGHGTKDGSEAFIQVILETFLHGICLCSAHDLRPTPQKPNSTD